MSLLALAEDAVRAAQAVGADEAEAYVWDARELHATALGSKVSTKDARTGGIGVRVVRNGALGFAALAPAGPASARLAAERAARFAALLPGTEARLPEPLRRAPAGVPAVPRGITGLDAEEARRVAQQALGAARRGTRGKVVYGSATLRRSLHRFAVASSRGVHVEEHGARAALEVECRLRVGAQERSGASLRVGRGALEPGAAGREARGRAEALLGARKLGKAVLPVVFDGEAAGVLVQMLTTALRGQQAMQRATVLAGKVGQPVASPLLTVRDGPGAGGPRAQRWDDEGTPAMDVTLIERGVLQRFLADDAAARALGQERTGSGLRGDDERYRRAPSSLPMGLAIAPGRGDAASLAQDAQRALLVRGGMMGLASLNPATGDFSVTAPNAFAARRGEARPLAPTTIAGSLPQFLASIEAVGADVVPHHFGSSPSLRVGGLTCAG